ncbi:MAG: leucine-rich repeat protein [Eubacteriales bacterium]|nr:leucine-rich repeat protein [Eubacteriales bacterium]
MMNIKNWCFRCMAELNEPGGICPECGYDNAKCENELGLLPPGVLAKQYVVGKALGSGGFGVTYIGLDANLRRRVAIKEYFPAQLVTRDAATHELRPYGEAERQAFEDGRQCAINEGRVIAAIGDAPGVVKVYSSVTANNTVYTIMEYIDGQTLSQRVKQLEADGRRMPWGALFPLIKPILRSLEQIHEHYVLHRDISPDNIMLRRENGQAVLLDFGAAHVLSDNSKHGISLRAGYAPVEQYSLTGELSGRSDEYALCATLYFALTGCRPVDAQERLYGHTPLPSPRSLGADVPEAVEQVLMKGMAMQAADRYATMSELLTALEAAEKEPEQAAEKEPASPRPIDQNSAINDTERLRRQSQKARPQSFSKEPGKATKPAPKPKKNGRRVLLAGTAVAAVVLAGVLLAPRLLNRPVPTAAVTTVSTQSPTAKVEAEENGYSYTGYSDKTAMITKWSGSDTKLAVPEMLGGYRVTGIGDRAFYNCSGLTSLTLPESVTSVGEYAFSTCQSLTSITIPDSVTKVGDAVFVLCERLKEIRISPSHPALELRDGVLFSKADKRLVWYPISAGKTEYSIPADTKFIGANAFSHCSSLTSIIIPVNVTSIGYAAFSSCSSLTDIMIPASVTKVGDGVFADCKNLKEIRIAPNHPALELRDGVLFSKADKRLVWYPMSAEEQEYAVPADTRSIGEFAFYKCSSLTSITIPKSVTSIQYAAFAECSSLTSVTIPEGVTRIGKSAFHTCSSLTSITLPESAEWISTSAFTACSKLKTVRVVPGSYAETWAKAQKLETLLVPPAEPTATQTPGQNAAPSAIS